MAEIFVMCPDCRLRVILTHSNQEIDDPGHKCKHAQNPANCPTLRPVLMASHQMLVSLEWQARRNAAQSAGGDRGENSS